MKSTTKQHLRRGHYRTYTSARPMFGKYVGKFWINPSGSVGIK